MKKILFFVFAFCAISVSAQNDLTRAANLTHYADKNVKETKKVVFIGNSITDAWPYKSPEFFESNNYIGRGISGQTSPQLLLRFRQDVLDLSPIAVVINIGTNDIALNTGEYVPEFTLSCIMSMAELADYHGIKVILTSVLPVGSYGWRPEVKDVPKKIDALNARIKAFAEANGFAYLDYNTPMRQADGSMKKDLAEDGVHPNAAGYAIMEKLVKVKIDEVINF